MNSLYRATRTSKQGFHQLLNREIKRKEEQMQMLPIIRQIRQDHPRLSCREIYYMLKPDTMGRDRFEAFCHLQGLKLEIRRNRYRTTDSLGVIRFPNILLTLEKLTGVNQVWVSDITYFQIHGSVYYLTFIMDLYSRKIVGYNVSKTLRTEDTTLKALKMAIKDRGIKKGSLLIIHSDGGGQYYSNAFKQLTKAYDMLNSMAENVYDNPHAERVNETIKNFYLVFYDPQKFEQLLWMVKKAVHLYNTEKPHQALKRLSPVLFECQIDSGLLTKTWLVNKKKKVAKKEKVYITIN